jgi:hypothetical protein
MRLVEVSWYDAVETSRIDWYSITEAEEQFPVDMKGELQISTGYVFRENDNGIVLCQTHTPNEKDKTVNSMSGLLFIPRPMIVEIKEK